MIGHLKSRCDEGRCAWHAIAVDWSAVVAVKAGRHLGPLDSRTYATLVFGGGAIMETDLWYAEAVDLFEKSRAP